MTSFEATLKLYDEQKSSREEALEHLRVKDRELKEKATDSSEQQNLLQAQYDVLQSTKISLENDLVGSGTSAPHWGLAFGR